MSDQSPDSSLAEFENPIIGRAYPMSGQRIPIESLVQSLLGDRYLQSRSDEELIGIIDQADQHWRDQHEDCVRKPGVIELYAPLMIACCTQRYDDLRKLREVASAEEKAALTARMGRLLTVQARCVLASAESLLLNEHFQRAYEAFAQAEWVARALPDEGAFRLCEVLWARYGQWVVAGVARRQGEMDSAQTAVAQLLREAGPQAEKCLATVEQLFSRHRWVLQERARLRRESSDSPPPESRPVESGDGAGALLALLDPLVSDIQSGRTTLEAARARANAEFPTLSPRPATVQGAAVFFESLAVKDLERAVLLLDLNCELALRLLNQPEVQSTCLGALGFALNRLAATKGSGFERAVSILGRAYALVESLPHHDLQAGNICVGLCVGYRGLNSAGELLQWGERAVDRLERSLEVPHPRGTGLALGTAYGLRGEARELAGDEDAALQDHFRALTLFREAQSSLDIRRAYHHISDLCLRTNHLDEAAAACDEILHIAHQVGDVDDVVSTTLPLAQALVRVGRLEPALRYLDLADRLVLDALQENPRDQKLLRYNFEHRIWAARFLGAVLRQASLTDEQRRDAYDESYEKIEGARMIALDLHRDDLLTAALLEQAILQESVGKLEAARSLCLSVDSIEHCPPQLRGFSYLVGGRIAAAQQQFADALAMLDTGLGLLPDDGWDDIRIRFLKVRAVVKEQLEDRKGAIADYEDAVKRTAGFRDFLSEESRVAVFGLAEDALDRLFLLNVEPSPLRDPKRALYWAEYSKSRALAELLGQSDFALPAPSREIAALYQEEQLLLAEVHSSRATSLTEAARVTLDQSHTIQSKKARLNQIWNELTSRFPEYVELRRGAVPSWDEIVQMTSN